MQKNAPHTQHVTESHHHIASTVLVSTCDTTQTVLSLLACSRNLTCLDYPVIQNMPNFPYMATGDSFWGTSGIPIFHVTKEVA